MRPLSSTALRHVRNMASEKGKPGKDGGPPDEDDRRQKQQQTTLNFTAITKEQLAERRRVEGLQDDEDRRKQQSKDDQRKKKERRARFIRKFAEFEARRGGESEDDAEEAEENRDQVILGKEDAPAKHPKKRLLSKRQQSREDAEDVEILDDGSRRSYNKRAADELEEDDSIVARCAANALLFDA